MKFVDVVNITVIAGNGGNGHIVHKKYRSVCKKLYGGNGGDGGNVWLVADSALNTLNYFCNNHEFRAEHGGNGFGNRGCTGRKGRDMFIKVPYGTRVRDRVTNELLGDLGKDQRCLIVAKGGRHGVVSKRFISGINKYGNYDSSKFHGKIGEFRYLLLELLLIADVGVLGLPNSGKSSFVKKISGSKTKVADYPFTTLVPYLGTVYVDNCNKFVIADIPGIIRGASKGLGLGIHFLKHLERCRMLLHFVDIHPIDGTNPIDNIISIEREIKNYSTVLTIKPRWLVFNKIDLLSDGVRKKTLEYIIKELRWDGRYYYISVKYNINVSLLCCNIMKFITCIA